MIKLFGWEKKAKTQLDSAREEELHWIKKTQILNMVKGISKYMKNLSQKFSDLRQALENLQLLDSCDYDDGYLRYIMSKVTRITQFRGSFICFSVGSLGLIYDIDISASEASELAEHIDCHYEAAAHSIKGVLVHVGGVDIIRGQFHRPFTPFPRLVPENFHWIDSIASWAMFVLF